MSTFHVRRRTRVHFDGVKVDNQCYTILKVGLEHLWFCVFFLALFLVVNLFHDVHIQLYIL